jgi:hypothetical protein
MFESYSERAVAKNNGSFVLKLFSKRYNDKIDTTDKWNILQEGRGD